MPAAVLPLVLLCMVHCVPAGHGTAAATAAVGIRASSTAPEWGAPQVESSVRSQQEGRRNVRHVGLQRVCLMFSTAPPGQLNMVACSYSYKRHLHKNHHQFTLFPAGSLPRKATDLP